MKLWIVEDGTATRATGNAKKKKKKEASHTNILFPPLNASPIVSRIRALRALTMGL